VLNSFCHPGSTSISAAIRPMPTQCIIRAACCRWVERVSFTLSSPRSEVSYCFVCVALALHSLRNTVLLCRDSLPKSRSYPVDRRVSSLTSLASFVQFMRWTHSDYLAELAVPPTRDELLACVGFSSGASFCVLLRHISCSFTSPCAFSLGILFFCHITEQS
jgi:hypothetical protein